MPMFTIHVNGTKTIVEAPSKSSAGAYGNRIAEVKVEPTSLADLQAADATQILKLEKGGYTQAELDAAEAEKKAAADKAAQEKAAKEAAKATGATA